MAEQRRLRITLAGTVQGTGFRPFLFRLATELDLTGWVLNSASGLTVEVEGGRTGEFLQRLDSGMPAAAVVLSREVIELELAGDSHFEIRSSDDSDVKAAGILPDLATCPECLAEFSDPDGRRGGYAFTNCTLCGPRYSIVRDIPYDRPNTTMVAFEMCELCRREYDDPRDRRFHAQPIACPACGPKLDGTIPSLASGRIVALKGIGGFQLLVDARDEQAVERLRRLKHRDEKPFALMLPDAAAVHAVCEISAQEETLLRSSAAPIVLLRPKAANGIAPSVAKSSPYLGVMLPCSPLHHLLMRANPFPVVATSGNRSDEPIAIANDEARARLAGIADEFLTHDRTIARACDDSVTRISRGRAMVLRRARGYAPLPVPAGRELPPVLAVGAHLKNTVAIAIGRHVYLSQHIGDLDTLEARQAFERAIDDLCRLYSFTPEAVVCDRHPDYASTIWARQSGLPVITVQHHHAHAAACAAENGVRGAYLAVVWDGTGYGLDGTIWGGEFFLAEAGRFERIAHLRPFLLPGGEAAIREGWRAAAALTGDGPTALLRMMERGLHSPQTTSVGRLFDAVAALCGVARESRFEGQAAMLLEREIGSLETRESYPLPDGDWRPLIAALLEDVRRSVPRARIAARFHNALAGWIVDVAERSAAGQVVLSGGCFQNRYLEERAAELLEAKGIHVFTHQRVPPNDGGIALGQAVLAAG
jgi:hydrogenase maturation protein HypF